MILSDNWIKRMAEEEGLFTPFADEQIQKGVLSFGASGFGYDMRLGRKFKARKSDQYMANVIDPKDKTAEYRDIEWKPGDSIFVAPNSTMLAETMESIKVPDNVLALPINKSTYARCGLIANVTPFDPGFEGIITIALVNPLDDYIRIYPEEGIIQVMFIQGNEVPNETYKSKGGKYHGSTGIDTARIKGS